MVEKVENNIGALLKNLLVKQSLSMRKLSEQTNIDTATISRIINGKRKATLEHLEKFSHHLDVSMHDLLEAAGYPIDHEKESQSELNQYIDDIQGILDPAILSNFSIEQINQKLTDYEEYVQTEDGKETIFTDFEEKIKRVDSVGPFIKKLKEFYERFRSRKGTSRELVLVGSALLYFIIPVDVIPDYLFPIGYLDDAIAVQMVAKLISKGQGGISL